ncbi:MAG: bifunctional glutamate N-acetyltransferase/amino-acid acetyltransferase ArgJ [Planctomycetales bacterium]|nr:bifunctional glutamate N-acetyltransferase/amino-acid acetyltransferase ArgJ [Planctomycetales bacterium]
MNLPKGFRASGVHSGIKKASKREDIALILSDRPAVGVGVYTQNVFRAAPVLLDVERTPSTSIRAVVANSGNANACTGEVGMQNALRMTEIAAAACEVNASDVLVLSTGIIGEQLPMETVERGIEAAAKSLGDSTDSLESAARGIMTTDTHHKIASKRIELSGDGVTITGIAKGAAMIGPNMATMLGIILTDANVSPEIANKVLRNAVEKSFHSISVEGHTSTNDTVLLLANGASGKTVDENKLKSFEEAVTSVCVDLAKSIPNDGEGATHLIEIRITGADSDEDARTIAKTVADSALVKTAICGADPNWGRIVSAVGYAKAKVDANTLQLNMNDTLLFADGGPVKFDAESLSESIRTNRTTRVEIDLGIGDGHADFWTCDLTQEYVTINADYHT